MPQTLRIASLATLLCLALGGTPGVALKASRSVLPAAGNAAPNWKMAGMLSVGGIPHRTTVCATLSPSGGDDSGAIQSAIDACPEGQVVSLGAGTFKIAEGHFLLIAKPITLPGAGPGVTILNRTGGAGVGERRFIFS
jgi:hypothetical protein